MASTEEDRSLYVFDYQPLDELGNEIRLLTIQKLDSGSTAESCRLEHISSDGTTVICCTIEHASLTQPPSYKALSYCWGNRNSVCTIHVNGFEVRVTENLEAALRQLGRNESVCLWVDALCINQSDPDERGRQVLRMQAIYNTASETICWLGVKDGDSPLAFDLIQILSKTNADSESAQYEEALMRLYRPSENHKYDAHWNAFLLLLSRPYWERVWVIQEIASSEIVWVRCGSRCAIWADVVKAVLSVPTACERSRISVVSRVLPPNLAYTRAVVTIDVLRGFTLEAKRKSEYVSLLNAMTRSNTALATVSGDKVYALLAITKDGQDLIPHPNYALSATEICVLTTTAIIAASSDLDVICYAGYWPRRALPSWVPEWTRKLPLGNMTWGNASREDLYNATGKSQGGEYLRFPNTVEFLEDGLVLRGRGCVVDVVHGLGAVDLDDILPIEVDELTDYGLVQPEPEQNRSQYSSETEIFRALWMSLVLGERHGQSGGSDFLNSLYVTQASVSEAIAKNVNFVFAAWYSINKGFEIHGRTLSHWFRVSTADPTRPERDMNDLTDAELKFLERVGFAMLHKRLLFTHEGYIGMAPHETRRGDKVCLLLGCRVPVVLRQRVEGGYELIGAVYVHGIMKGEALTQQNFQRLEDFCIH